MFWRHVAAVPVTVVAVIASTGSAHADSASIGTSTQASRGTVVVTRTLDPTTAAADYAVTFQGEVTDHGWSYAGTLTGTGTTWGWVGGISQLPYLSITSDGGTVTGWCGGASQISGLLGTGTLDMEFNCILSRSGSTPWELQLDATLQGPADYSSTESWSGDYVENDVATPQVTVDNGPTYGEVQLGDQTAPGSIAYGPLRFSGQIAIGPTLYRGDLVSGTSAWLAGPMPPMAVSGSSDGVSVSGTCSGAIDSVAGNVTSAYDFSCDLAVGSAAPVTVSLRALFTNGTGACSYRDCWGDQEGWFSGS